MKQDLIPLVWDNGRIGSVAADPQGILRLRHAIDDDMEREICFTRGSLKFTNLAPPFHTSPSVDAVEISALLDEFEWHRK